MKILRLFHFAGWLKFEQIRNEPDWLNIWTKAAERASSSKCTLIVFEVPEVTSSEDIEYIEKYLQDKHQTA